jgi:hypothetical protein
MKSSLGMMIGIVSLLFVGCSVEWDATFDNPCPRELEVDLYSRSGVDIGDVPEQQGVLSPSTTTTIDAAFRGQPEIWTVIVDATSVLRVDGQNVADGDVIEIPESAC